MTRIRVSVHGDPKICKNGDTAVKILFLIFYYAYVGYLTYLTHLWINLRLIINKSQHLWVILTYGLY
ncbi:hypothetical protein GIB67_026439 [Kingdonia uniflora]|uniref:Uncharacterized protein n=1 Tax=Kingdonia uniflora TaxID=39325 RepID=A0A7J7P694_9MAGN|nr:hypothetical protein GIB67_026439 [Kingdonia uniflora]